MTFVSQAARVLPRRATAVLLSFALPITTADLAPASTALTPRSPFNLELHRRLGTVTDVTRAVAPSERPGQNPVVFIIQDVHSSPQVQRRISAILAFLLKRYDSPSEPPLVAVEGGAGWIDTREISRVPNSPLKRAAVNRLVSRLALSGTERFAALQPMPRILYGVDDERLYSAHKRLFKQSYPARAELLASLSKFDDVFGQTGARDLALESATRLRATADRIRLLKEVLANEATEREIKDLDFQRSETVGEV